VLGRLLAVISCIRRPGLPRLSASRRFRVVPFPEFPREISRRPPPALGVRGHHQRPALSPGVGVAPLVQTRVRATRSRYQRKGLRHKTRPRAPLPIESARGLPAVSGLGTPTCAARGTIWQLGSSGRGSRATRVRRRGERTANRQTAAALRASAACRRRHPARAQLTKSRRSWQCSRTALQRDPAYSCSTAARASERSVNWSMRTILPLRTV
jgi:hypothetical protein